MALLSLEGVHLSFGGVAALAGVSLEVDAGEFFAIIGPNGAGKTSIFNCISGIYRPNRGRILFDGQDITPLRPHRRAVLRIARTFQNIALFKGMTVLDNVKIGRHILLRPGRSRLRVLLRQGRRVRSSPHRATIERQIHRLCWSYRTIRHKVVGTPAVRPAEASGAGPGRSPFEPWRAAARRADGGHERGRNRGHGALHPLR